MTTRRLRAVSDGEKAAPRKRAPRKAAPRTVAAAVARCDERQVLSAMAARIAAAIDNPSTPARDLAALIRRRLDISRELAALEPQAGDRRRRAKKSVVSATPDEPFDYSAI
jgi:hypothetical protein